MRTSIMSRIGFCDGCLLLTYKPLKYPNIYTYPDIVGYLDIGLYPDIGVYPDIQVYTGILAVPDIGVHRPEGGFHRFPDLKIVQASLDVMGTIWPVTLGTPLH